MPDRDYAEHRLRTYEQFGPHTRETERKFEYHAYYRSICLLPGFKLLEGYEDLCAMPYIPEEEWLVFSIDEDPADDSLSKVVLTGSVNWGPEGHAGRFDPLLTVASEFVINRLGFAMFSGGRYRWNSLAELNQRASEWREDNNVEITTRIHNMNDYMVFWERNQNLSEHAVGA